MQKTSGSPPTFEPQFIVIISKYPPRQTAIKALLGMIFLNIPLFVTENYPTANQYLHIVDFLRGLVVIDGWSLGIGTITGNDLLHELDSTKQNFPEMRCLYLVEKSNHLRIQKTDKVLAGNISSDQFIDTLRDMLA